MKVTFIMPCVGKKPGRQYVKTWQMEPLVIAVLSSLTPPDVERVFYDDRLETIPYDDTTDLVAITVETYTARRSYQIAAEYRKRGVPVVMGGFHVTLMPEEALEHADAIVVGEAEELWPKLLDDFKNEKLQKRYWADHRPDLKGIFPDRSIYTEKKYTNITLVETGRGCRFACEFCSIASFFNHSFSYRPPEDVITELDSLQSSNIVFFVDDNIAADNDRLKTLLTGMREKNIKWVGQVSINVAKDEKLVDLMKKSGCLGILIGFESMEKGNLKSMGKGVNNSAQDYNRALSIFRRFGLVIYGTFIFGYDYDTRDTFRRTYAFAQKHRFFFTAFNHVVPFPGTPLYKRLENEKKLIYNRWWLEDGYHFGDLAFRSKGLQPSEISALCLKYRKKMYSLPSIIRRGLDFHCNCRTPYLATAFFALNALSGKDVSRRQGLPLGVSE